MHAGVTVGSFVFGLLLVTVLTVLLCVYYRKKRTMKFNISERAAGNVTPSDEWIRSKLQII